MTISVYLDTHHLSRMASGRSQISKFLSDPSYSFVFSTSHVVESLPKESKENSGAIARLRIILGPHSWLFGWGRVALLESKMRPVTLPDLFCRKDQLLFADSNMDRSQWLRRARQDIKEMLRNNIVDGNSRRSAQARLLKHGKLTPEAFRLLRRSFNQTVQREFVDFPQAISFFTNVDFYGFLEGKVSEEEFKSKFMEAFADPVALATMSSMPDLSSILDLSRFFWIQMDGLAELLTKFVLGVRSEISRSDADYSRERPDLEMRLAEHELRAALVKRVAGIEISVGDLMDMPGTRLFVDVFSKYMLEKLDRFANPVSPAFQAMPEFKRSDAADFTHVFYYPYVDIFGCDGAMRDRMRRAGWPVAKVVTTDAELESKLIEMAGR